MSQCETILREEYENLGHNYEEEIEKMQRKMDKNHHQRIRERENEEKRREQMRTEELRAIQQQYFHHASPIPHNYYNTQWPPVKNYKIKKIIFSKIPKKKIFVKLFS